MAKALIICVAGMSSSLMAKKTTEYFEKQGKDIQVDAINANEAKKVIENKEFDLYLVSPQAKMQFNALKVATDATGQTIANIPPQAYIPIPMGIEKLANLIVENL